MHVSGDPHGTSVSDRVAELLGHDRVAERGGIPIAAPGSEEEVGALLEVASEMRWTVLPFGSGLEPGMPFREIDGPGDESEPRPDLVVTSRSLKGNVAHEAGDLCATASAGCTLRELQDTVSRADQWLALDPPGGGEATLGGTFASGISGPLAAQYGRPRDQILGLTLVDGAGRVLKLGGRVVKNVAGFDLVRLATGSRGTIGMITEVTVRLYPSPQADRVLVWVRESTDEAWSLGRTLATLPVPVAAAELLVGRWEADLPAGRARVVLRLTGSPGAVDAVTRRLRSAGGDPDRVLEGSDCRGLFEQISIAEGAHEAALRVHTLPSDAGAVIRALERREPFRLGAGLLVGTVWAYFSGERAAEGLERARTDASASGKRVSVAGRFPAEGSGSSVRSEAYARLRAEIVRGLDPSGILPGAWRERWLSAEGAVRT